MADSSCGSVASKSRRVSWALFPTAIIAAGLATLGTFWAFLAAGVFYHINGIADGIDGEIARVKYEFSVTGEWVDTVTDDLKDVLFYAGLGYGAWAAGIPSLAGAGASLWATLGAVAVAGKLRRLDALVSDLRGSRPGRRGPQCLNSAARGHRHRRVTLFTARFVDMHIRQCTTET